MTGVLIMIFGTVAALLYIFRKDSDLRQSSSKVNTDYIEENENRYEGPTLYKQRGVKSFSMKGMYFRGLDPGDAGAFFGEAISEDNPHDQYAVAIVNSQDKLLGYTPRGNKRLSDSLVVWSQSRALAWGVLEYDDYDDKWYGKVYIAVGCEFISEYPKLFQLIQKQNDALKQKIKNKEFYFELLERHNHIEALLTKLNRPAGINYTFPKNLMPSISKFLEDSRDWTALVELERYSSVLDELNEKYKATTLKRIELAKENIAKD